MHSPWDDAPFAYKDMKPARRTGAISLVLCMVLTFFGTGSASALTAGDLQIIQSSLDAMSQTIAANDAARQAAEAQAAQQAEMARIEQQKIAEQQKQEQKEKERAIASARKALFDEAVLDPDNNPFLASVQTATTYSLDLTADSDVACAKGRRGRKTNSRIMADGEAASTGCSDPKIAGKQAD